MAEICSQHSHSSIDSCSPLLSPTLSQCHLTRSQVDKESLVKGLKTPTRIKGLGPKMDFIAPKIDIVSTEPFVAVIDHDHLVKFGQAANGKALLPPRIPLCRLVHMEVVRTLICPAKDANLSLQLVGSCRLSIGFMQALIELLTLPKDLVLDWTYSW